MKNKVGITTTLLLLSIMIQHAAFGQNLEKHQWKSRVLLILSQNENNDQFKEQIAQFTNETALEKRKLVLYKVSPESYILEEKRINSSVLFERYIKDKEAFRVVLIGLDGGVKLSQSNPLISQDLFRIIDSMPMRRSEIRRK